MIPKRIQPVSWFRDMPTSHLLGVSSKGLEKQVLRKIAAQEFPGVTIRPEKGHSFVHLITLGAGETFGPNANADYFNEKTANFYFFLPKKNYTLADGLVKYHSTFTKYGAVYREHNNSRKGGTPQGTIVAEMYNQPMHRGELIVKLPDSIWGDDIQKIANGEPVWWSMGAGVPFDLCGLCGNKASTRSAYCEHLKYNKLAITKEGYQIFAINDQPHFHDISRVIIPADRIAGTLRKVASGAVADFEEDVSKLWLPIDLINKIANRREADRATILDKLANIEKRILLEGKTPEETNLSQAAACPVDEDLVTQKLQGIPLEKLISLLNSRKMMLPPRVFMRIVMHKPTEEIPGLAEMPESLGSIFSDLRSGDISELLSDGSYMPGYSSPDRGTAGRVEELEDSLSLETEPVRRRIVIIAIRGGAGNQMQKKASSTRSVQSKILAKEYAKYQLSFLANAGSDDLVHLTALYNSAVV
jgi:hypothetical protein